MNNSEKTILMIVNEDQYFVSHRMGVALGAIEKGWRVVVAAAPKSGCEEKIRAAGIDFVSLPLDGDGLSLRAQFNTLKALVSLFRKHREAVIHLVGMKMLLAGNIAYRIAGCRGGVVNAICGMGSMFIEPDKFKPLLILKLLRSVWQRNKVTTIVQNHDDEELMLRAGVLRKAEIVFIKGSGVDLKLFTPVKKGNLTPGGKIRIIFTGRLLRSKGVEDVIKTANILRKKWEGKVEFMICGGLSTNSDSMTRAEMEAACDGTYLIWGGNRGDVRELLMESRIMFFPGYYREGVPLSLIEASAAGLPIVTCDSVGCKDTIDGNGVKLPPRHPEMLAEEIDKMLEDDELCWRLGQRSREIAERDYAIERVVEKHLEIYGNIEFVCAHSNIQE